MSKFKVGDRVRYKNPEHGGGTVVKVNSLGVVVDTGGEFGLCTEQPDRIELVESASPIRTVTRREIVPGSIDLPNGTSMYIDTQDGEVSVDLDELWLDADSLREAAHLFNQLAEVLDEQAVSGKPAKPNWIEWHGGKCPVDGATQVEITYDDQVDRGEAWQFVWSHNGHSDISAYRVLPCAN